MKFKNGDRITFKSAFTGFRDISGTIISCGESSDGIGGVLCRVRLDYCVGDILVYDEYLSPIYVAESTESDVVMIDSSSLDAFMKGCTDGTQV